MAEAFVILGTVSNIFQFIELGFKVLDEGQELYKSFNGQRDEHKELELAAGDTKSFADKAKTLRSLSKVAKNEDEEIIQRLAKDCEMLAHKIVVILDDLKVPAEARYRWVEVFKQTVRGINKKQEIQDLQRRLKELDRRLRARVSIMLQEYVHAKFSIDGHIVGSYFAEIKNRDTSSSVLQAIRDLDAANGKLGAFVTDSFDDFRSHILRLVHGQESNHRQQENEMSILSARIEKMLEAAKISQRKQDVLKSLMFPEIQAREDTIHEAHKETLRWLFCEPETTLVRWLKHENGIYWVKGKVKLEHLSLYG